MFSKSVFVLLSLCCYVFGDKPTQGCQTEAMEKVIEAMKELVSEASNELGLMQNGTEQYRAIVLDHLHALHGNILPEIYEDCSQIQESAGDLPKNGVYTIVPKFWGKPVEVYCDFTTEGGGWTLIQRRDNYPVQENFYRNWKDYQKGFGNVTRDFWIGNDVIFALTNNKKMDLRIELEDWDSNHVWAEYTNFYVEGPSEKFKIWFGRYNGNAGDGLRVHRGQRFATYNSDESHCAVWIRAAWWFESCGDSRLNGVYNASLDSREGIIWYKWKNTAYSMKRTEMKVRPTGF